MAVPPKHWFTRASDASPWWLGLTVLVGCGSLPQAVGLRWSLAQPPRQTGRSDLCSRHQDWSTGHSAWCVIRVTSATPDQPGLLRIGLGRRAGGSRRRPYPIRLASSEHCMDAAGAGACCMSVSLSDRKSVAQTPLPASLKCSRLELFVCSGVLAGVVLSARAGRRAVGSYG